MNTALQCPVAHGFDPFSASYLADPYPLYSHLREEMPVAYVPKFDLYLVTRYDDAVRILKDNKTFSASNATTAFMPIAPEAAVILNSGFPRKPTFSSCDPPRHPKMRFAASRCLTPRRWAASQPELRRYLEELIDRMTEKVVADIAADIAVPLAALAGFRLLGFPIEDSDLLKSWCGKRVMLTYGDLSVADQVEAAHNLVDFWTYCREFVQKRLDAPDDDLTSDLLALSKIRGDDLTTEDVINMVYSIALASHETTASAILNGMRRILPRHEDWNALREDHSLIPNAVEELLRFDSPTITHRRKTTVATEIGGVSIPSGATVMMLLGAANHDPRHFPKPETFDIRRKDARAHLAFGKDWHYCLGAPLARFEYGLVLERLTTRTPNMRLVEEQAIRYAPVVLIRVPDKLLVEPSPPVS